MSIGSQYLINEHMCGRIVEKTEQACPKDPGGHYRKYYKGIQLDPYRVASVYNISSGPQFQILKKALGLGTRGHKDAKQDLLDIISAATRALEMMEEDKVTT